MNKKYRKALIAGNWKMNMLPSEAKGFVEALKAEMPKQKSCDVAICAPFVVMPALMKATGGSRIALGAQDVSAHDKGAYTGEVSIAQLKDIGTKYVIIGHSERRQYHGETDELVNAKSLKTLDAGITPIICVGESLDQRERGLTLPHIEYQVRAALTAMSEEQVRRCVIAYEPIWAIGTGKTATADQAEEVCEYIRGVIRKAFSARTARSTTILYGGSMNAGNAMELLGKADIDGGLIGGASLKPTDFAKIIAATAQESAHE
ncbi:MAG: triose-phosphate isomerase [Oscillospiraceae bacterium]|nr:triose-phosphate isomerase [Oscillospiraceae bacterium]